VTGCPEEEGRIHENITEGGSAITCQASLSYQRNEKMYIRNLYAD
jgi:hypothetical protein